MEVGVKVGSRVLVAVSVGDALWRKGGRNQANALRLSGCCGGLRLGKTARDAELIADNSDEKEKQRGYQRAAPHERRRRSFADKFCSLDVISCQFTVGCGIA